MFSKYYQDELTYLRELGREFSLAYPTLAPMLADRGVDPDVERLLEGVAFLTGRIREKLDDEVPEFIHGLTALLFPHLARPLPSTSILEIKTVGSALRELHVVPAGTEFATVPVDGVACTFRSSTACTLAPVVIEDVRLDPSPGGKQRLSVSLRSTSGGPLARALPEALRLHLAGETRISRALLLALLRHAADVIVTPTNRPGVEGREVSLGPRCLHWAGFEDDESLLPMSRHVLPGFRLLQEYYVQPAKFAFVDVRDVRRLAQVDAEATRATLTFRFDHALPPSMRVTRENIRLHCVPVVNVFETTANPIRLTPGRERFIVRPAGLPLSHAEVYAIAEVQGVLPGSSSRVTIPPFFGFSHGGSADHGFYVTHLSQSVTGDGTDVSIAIGTAEGSGAILDAEMVSVGLLATNCSAPSALRPGDICVHTASTPPFVTFSNIATVTPHVPAPIGQELQWRAVAHAAINLRGLTEPEVLRAVIDVYNVHALVDRQAARANELRVGAIRDVRVRPEERLYRGAAVRGVAIDIDLDEDGFADEGEMYLFSAVLDRLFCEYVSINSFACTTARTLRSKIEFKWPPRNGQTTLL